MGITGSVGVGGANAVADVVVVQLALANHASWLYPLLVPKADGHCGPDTIDAIRKFQETAGALYKDDVDGRVRPGGFTIARLSMGYIRHPSHRAFTPICWARAPAGSELTPSLYRAAATRLDCEVEAIQAVGEQESGIRGPWDEDGRPTILYERHLFSHHTGGQKHGKTWSPGRWDATHRDIACTTGSNSTHEVRDRYGRFSAQYAKLFRAATLDEDAALLSASWGSFQILGENFADAGFSNVRAFVDAMFVNQVAHLDAFVAFILKHPNLQRALKRGDWAAFANGYNGPKYKVNAYDTKMKAIYDRLIAARPRVPVHH